jgi:hypothetical protein
MTITITLADSDGGTDILACTAGYRRRAACRQLAWLAVVT